MPNPPSALEQIEVMGVPITAASQAAVNLFVGQNIHARVGGTVFAANTDVLRKVTRNPELLKLYQSATVVTPDGMPVVWASKIQRQPLPERISNSYYLRSFATVAAREGFSAFYLGGNPGVAEACADALKTQEPTLKIAGTYCPPYGFEANSVEIDKIRQMLRDSQPDVLYIAVSWPKGEQFAALLRDEFPTMWFFAVGIGFSYVAGEVKQGPLWAQRLGVEWLIRLVQEPRRLFRRYLLDDLPFLIPLFRSALRARRKASTPQV